MSTLRKLVSLGTTVTLVAAAAIASARSADPINDARQTLAAFERTDPGLTGLLDRSAGYVIFPSVGKGAVGVGGAHGDGVLFDNTGKPIARVTLTQVSVGAQLGGQSFAELLVLESPQALQNFQRGQFSLSAQASAVALNAGASANAQFRNGVAVFTATKGGLMYEASVGGQKFRVEPLRP